VDNVDKKLKTYYHNDRIVSLLYILQVSLLSVLTTMTSSMDVKMGNKPERLYNFYKSLARYEELRESDYENHIGFIFMLMKNYYSKYSYLLYIDSTYLSMMERLHRTIKPIIYKDSKEGDYFKILEIQSFLKVEKSTKKVLERYLKTLCLYFSKTRLPSVLNREIAGYLFGDITEIVFLLPPKETLRIQRLHRVNYKSLKKTTKTTKKTCVK
jgi:hypothetical protein